MYAISAKSRGEPRISADKENQPTPPGDFDQRSTLTNRRPGAERPIDDATAPGKVSDDFRQVGRTVRICEIEESRPSLSRLSAAAQRSRDARERDQRRPTQ